MAPRFRYLLLGLILATSVALAAIASRPSADDLPGWLEEAWGLRVDRVVALDPGSPWRDGRWLVLASLPRNRTRDLYLVTGRIAPNGVPIEVATPVNLTLSEWADDTDLLVAGTRAATLVRDYHSGKVLEVHVRDMAGEDPEVAGTRDWPRMDRLKHAVTNWAETGSAGGVSLRVWRVEPPVEHVDVRFEGDEVVLAAEGAELEYIEPQPRERLPTLHWVANVGRRLRGLGPAVELLKEVYFTANELVESAKDTLTEEEPAEVAVAKPEVVEAARREAELQIARHEKPWPPPPLRVVLDERREGEGLWQEVSAERTRRNPNAPPPFYQTFIRVDAERPRKRVFISVWDPHQVSLRFQTGTSEPISTTGRRGRGRIPRRPELLERVIGGFNGGFQTFHGKYGVYVDRRLYVPPLTGIATVLATDDGRTGFGTWEAGSTIGPEVLDLRQNLPPIVEDGVINPYGIIKWGASQDVAGAVGAFTVRSGLCHTQGDYMAYFWCEFCDAPGLGRAMRLARCDYGMHLDMNSGHSGFEFYRNIPAERRKDFPKKELGHVEKTDQWFHATLMVPRMRHMRSPTRYLRTDYRDFFYLVLRDVMPGPGSWRTEGVVGNEAYPPALALSKDDEGVIKLDLKRVRATVLPAAGDERARSVRVTVEPARLKLGLELKGAVVHRLGGRAIRPIPDGAPVLATDQQGNLRALRWKGPAPAYRDVIGVPDLPATGRDPAVLRASRIRAFQAGPDGLFEGPVTGGKGTLVERLAGEHPRLLLQVLPPQPAAFRL